MTLIVFLGPSCPYEVARARFPDAVIFGPATCGDVYRALRLRPRAIALIDGYFDHRLAPWHKELLFAIASGVVVYGAASMGALRAAELDSFGMVGVGTIYSQFSSGELEDDDEVAVVHQAADREYAATSDAMVNIRATLRAACNDGVIDQAAESAIVRAAKEAFYPERSITAAVAVVSTQLGSQASELAQWLSVHGLVDQKRTDCDALFARLEADLAHADQRRSSPDLHFEHTHFFDVLQRNIDCAGSTLTAVEDQGHAQPTPDHTPTSTRELSGQREHDAIRASFRRALALVLAARAGANAEPSDVQRASEYFRRQHGLLTPESTNAWLTRNSLDLAAFTELMNEEALVGTFGPQADALAKVQLEGPLFGTEQKPQSALVIRR